MCEGEGVGIERVKVCEDGCEGATTFTSPSPFPIACIPSFTHTYTHTSWYKTLRILENVEHFWGKPELAGYYGYMHMNRLTFTLKWWAESLAFMSAIYAHPYLK